MAGSPVLGIDVGGTKTLAIVSLPNGRILGSDYRPTPSSDGPDICADAMAAAAREAANRAGLPLLDMQGVAVAVAGLVDAVKGTVLVSPNLPKWNNVPLAGMLQERLALPCLLVNDANAAALGESRYGAGKGVMDMVFITISTGIGGGIIIDGKLYTGAHGFAGEMGHMTIDPNGPLCGCGNNGCWEVLASGTAIARMATESLSSGRSSTLRDTSRLRAVDAREVFEAARKGDLLACEIVSKAADHLGIGLANLVNIFNPAMLVIGGGVSKEWDAIVPAARVAMEKRAFKIPAQEVRLEPAVLGDYAGALGAVALALAEEIPA